MDSPLSPDPIPCNNIFITIIHNARMQKNTWKDNKERREREKTHSNGRNEKERNEPIPFFMLILCAAAATASAAAALVDYNNNIFRQF